MKLSSLYISALLTALLLTACGEKATEETAPAAKEAAPSETAAPAAEPAAPKAVEAGGYEPTAEERVPGITKTQEELDKTSAEALANTPLPAIPGETPAAIPEAAPTPEAAPAS
jgi:hypothetical protein